MKDVTSILAVIMTLITFFSLTACSKEKPKITEGSETVGTSVTVVTEACDHIWMDATYENPEECRICGTVRGDARMSYFEENGLDVRILDRSGVYSLEQTCGTNTDKTTVLEVTVEGYETVSSDDTHAGAEGYEWKIMTIKMHLFDENAQQYGINTWNYLWDNFYIGCPGGGDDNGLFDGGMPCTIEWNGTQYTGGLLHIEETAGVWERNEAGKWYLDIHVTVSARVPVGYDGFVFGLEGHGWEWTEGKYLHQVITPRTLLFRLD